MDVLSKKVDALGERLDFLPKKIDKDSKEIADLTAKIEEAQKTMANLRSELTARRDSSTNRGNEAASRLAMKPTEAGAIASGHEADVTMQALLTPGVEQFEKKQYKEASEEFNNLARTKPEDARVWYYRRACTWVRDRRLERRNRAAGDARASSGRKPAHRPSPKSTRPSRA